MSVDFISNGILFQTDGSALLNALSPYDVRVSVSHLSVIVVCTGVGTEFCKWF